ncbi:50S ribosomal protein L24 [Myxococcota bacterium]
MRRLQVGDEVIVIRGNHKGKRGKVTRLLPSKNAVVIEGVNVIKRHLKSGPHGPGRILELEAPLEASKVMPIDPETGQRTRVRTRTEDGQKVRVAVRSGAALPTRVQS